MFLQVCVILFTGGVCLSACWDTTHPLGSRHPPWKQTPPLEQTHPPGSRPPRADTPPWSRRPRKQTPPSPQKQTPPSPGSRHPPLGSRQTPGSRHLPLGADTPSEQRPPWEADSRIRSTSGRYASYWNAFLCWLIFLLKTA